MAKGSKKQKKTGKEKKVVQKSAPVAFNRKWLDILLPVIIAIFLVILLKPLVVDHLSPQGVDVLATIGKMHQVREFHKETGQRALWNPYLFCGMPLYHRLSPVVFSVDTLLKKLGRWFSVVFMFYIFGALGFYLLARYLKMSPLVAFFGSLIFILMPHYKSLYLVGHLSKFEALMVLPWIFLTFRYFLDERNLLSAALFALAFGVQIRTQHYQIVFYTAVMVFALGVYPLLKDLIDRQYGRFAKSTGLLIAAVILAIGMSAQPLFLAKEYLPYSKRGKTTVDVEQGKAKDSGGVSMKYATQWSTHPSEILTWLVPRFYGGMSSEKYDGGKYPRFRGQELPTYWGHMPFTQSYEYMGVITLLLALLGLIAYRKEKSILSMIIFVLWLILLSFGRHLEWFYALFYNYVPYFNKFRAPMMSVTVTYFVFSVFALYGLKYLADLKRNGDWFKDHKTLWYLVGGFFVLGLILWLYAQGASFTKAGGDRLSGQALKIIRSIRKEYFTHDVLRYLIIVVLAGGALIGYVKNKLNFTLLVVALGLIAVIDLVNIQARVSKKYSDVKRIEQRYFRPSATDQFLLGDKEIFRVFPSGQLFGDNRWAYFHQTIGGYSPIKMYAIEELVEKNIYNGYDRKLPINWNVLKILNVKYVVLQNQVQYPLLKPVFADQQNKLYTYLFTEHLPRAFFVGKVRVIKDEVQRLKTINSADFDPATEAILEEPLTEPVSQPDSAYTRVVSFNPNAETFDVYSDKQALLVISEVSYPPGWKILMDGKRVDKIYKTDHAVMSIVVPPGRHKIELTFEPDSFYKNIKIAAVSAGLIYLGILIPLVISYLRRKRTPGQA